MSGRGGRGGGRGGGRFGGRNPHFSSDVDFATIQAFNKAEKDKALFPDIEEIDTAEPTEFERNAAGFQRQIQIPLNRSPYFYIPPNGQQIASITTGASAPDNNTVFGELDTNFGELNIYERLRWRPEIERARSSLVSKAGREWALSVWDQNYFPPKLWNSIMNPPSTENTNTPTTRRFKAKNPKKRALEDDGTQQFAKTNADDTSAAVDDPERLLEDSAQVELDDDDENVKDGLNDEENEEDEYDYDDDDDGEDDYGGNYFDNGEDYLGADDVDMGGGDDEAVY